MHTPQRSAKDQFDKQATHYNAQWNSWSEETLVWMLDHAECRPTDLALDVATGTGYTALAFAPHVRSVIGLDISPGMLAEAAKRAADTGAHNVTFQEGAAERLPFPDSSFDLVLCRIAAHHFLDVNRFAAETARVLKPGGRFVLMDTTVPDGDGAIAVWQNEVEALRDPSHVKNYTPNEWRNVIESSGLTIEEITTTGSGITLPLEDWLTKAGAVDEQAQAVRERFLTAPEGACAAFRIVWSGDDCRFTWMRVAAAAVKP